ncbi:MAG: signal peptidase I [Acidobacteriota bacterium]
MTPKPYPKSTLREYFETIVISVIIVLFTKTFVFQHFKIPTGSMERTLLIGDHLMVNRYIYRKESLPLLDKVLPTRDVRRGDVVVFKWPDDPRKDFIKRVIGIPGDTLELRQDVIYVNGRSQEEPYKWLDPARVREGRLYFESRMRTAGPYVVPPDKYFLMGDNRYNSQDSRFWNQTFARRDEIKGRALFVWWSYEGPQNIEPNVPYQVRIRDFAKMLVNFPVKTRWSRSFTMVH